MSYSEDLLDAAILIMDAAMTAPVPVFVAWRPHIQGISVHAYPADQSYAEGAVRKYLLDATVYLDRDNARQHLRALLKKIEALSAKEAA